LRARLNDFDFGSAQSQNPRRRSGRGGPNVKAETTMTKKKLGRSSQHDWLDVEFRPLDCGLLQMKVERSHLASIFLFYVDTLADPSNLFFKNAQTSNATLIMDR